MTNPKRMEYIARLLALRAEALALAKDISLEGAIGGSLQVADGGESFQFNKGEFTGENYDLEPLVEADLGLCRLGSILDNTAINLGIWKHR